MPDFFEVDDVVKDYDSAIVARIFRYVRPYKALLVWSVLALILSTLGELLLPVLVQRTIDDSLVVSWSALAPQAIEDPSLKTLIKNQEIRQAGSLLFIRRTGLSALTDQARKSLEVAALLDTGPYYLTPWTDLNALPERIRGDIYTKLGTNGEQASEGEGSVLPVTVDMGGALRLADGSLVSSGPALVDGWFVAPEDYVLSLAPADARVLRVADRKVVAKNEIGRAHV